MEISLIKEASYKISIWSGGRTKELYIYPKESSYAKRDFIFRISSATIEEEESKFTNLQGINRFITTLDNEIILKHNGVEEINLKPYEVYEFSGDISTESGGIAEDFNLMVKEGIPSQMESLKIDGNFIEERLIARKTIIYSPIGELIIQIKNEEYTIKEREALFIDKDSEEEFVRIRGGQNQGNRAIICKIDI